MRLWSPCWSNRSPYDIRAVVLLAAFAVLAMLPTDVAGYSNGDEAKNDSRPYLSLNSPSVEEGDSGTTTLTFSARLTDANGRTKAGTETITANYQVLSESGDTATAGTDYRAASGTLTFAPGQTSKTIDVSVRGDTEVEDDETLSVKWTGWTNVLLVRYAHTGTITNDDEESPRSDDRPYLGVDSPSVQEGDSGTTTLTFTARLTDANGRIQSSSETITANYQVLSESGDTATAGTDYTPASGAVTFAPGEISRTIDVSVRGDTEAEGDETLTLKWVAPWTNVLLAGFSATGTITNDDTAAATLSIADASATEGSALSFTVTLNNAVPGGFTVTPIFTDGVTLPGRDLSAITANQGSDYSAGRLTLDFAGTAGETATLTVPTVEDGVAEYPELFTVGLSVSGTSHRVTATDTATGTIWDDDSGGARIAGSEQIQDKGSYWRLWSPPDPTTNRYEYYCDIPKRVVETTNRAIRSKVFQLPCKVHAGGIPAGAVVSMWSAGTATATNGTSGTWDYNFYHSKFTMYPGDYGIQRLSFRINDDQSVETAETFQFALKWTTKVGYPPFWFTLNESVHTMTVTIDDDDEYQLTVSPDSVAEGGGAKTVTVTAANVGGAKLAEARKIGVQVGAGSDFAVEGTDYQTVNNFDITIPKGSSSGSGTFTLTPIDDAHLEAGERISLSGSGSSQINGRTLTPRVKGSGLWLTDSETITLSATPDINEGGGTQTVTVTATASGTAQRAIPLTISVGKSGDTAVSGTDYNTVSDVTLTIPSGSKTGTATVQITPVNDTTQENDETITISGSAGTYGLSSAIADTSVKILDNDVILALSPASTGEEAGAKTVTVTARVKTARTASRALTVSVGKPGDQAESGTDYGAVTDFTLTLAANQVSGTATFTFTPRDDTIIEGSETLTVHATGTGVDVNSATLTMTETDTTDFVISLNPSRVPERRNENNNNQSFPTTVTISTTGGYTVSKDVYCGLQNGGGTATWGTDYMLFSQSATQLKPNLNAVTLTIKAGQTSGSVIFLMRPEADSAVEGDETVQIKGHSVNPHVRKSCSNSDRTVNSDPYPADITITDDETSISLSASPSSVAENAGATSVTVTATMGGNRNAPAAMPVIVTVGKTGDGATSGTDYETVDPFLITIPQGSKSATKTITFTPIDDTLNEGNEAVTLSGTNPKTSVSSTSLTITDNETRPYLSANSPSVKEGDSGTTTMTFTASLNKTSSATITASYKVYSKTGDTATAGTDYTETSGTLTFAPGETSKTVDVSVAGDTLVEGDETLTWEWTSWSNVLLVSFTGTGTIKNDDYTAITLAAAPASVTENGGAKTVTVTATKSKAATSDIALTISVGKSGDSATSGTDYTAVDDFTLTIKKDATTGTGTFTLTPINDTLYEGTSESLTVSGSAAGYKVSDTSVAITDDDASSRATVSLSVKPKRVKECSGDTTMTVTAELPDDVYTLPEDRKITLSVGKSTDGATSGTDYTAVDDFTLTIPAGQHTGLATFTLTPTDDTTKEGDETFTVHGTAKRLAVGNDAVATIEDDDQPIIILTMDPKIIPEQGKDKTTTVTVTASLWTGTDSCSSDGGGPPDTSANASSVGGSAEQVAKALLGPGARAASSNSDQTVAVTIGDTGDTAVSGTDYTAVSSFNITIKAGQTSGTATFTTRAKLDSLLEPPETLTVKGAATGTTVTPTKGQVDDKDKVTPTLKVSPSSVSEGAGDTIVTVTLDTGGVSASKSTDVPFKVSSGTAAAGTDFADVEDFEGVLKAGETSVSATFTLTPTDDKLIEGDETIKVSIPGSKPALEATVTLTDNDSSDITLTASPTSASEGDSAKTVTVTASTDGGAFLADRTVTIAVGASGDGATSGTDYAAVTDFDITIKAGKTSGSDSFTLTPTQDTVIEGDESITVGGTSTGVTVKSATVTLTDDDSTDITLRVSPSSLSEGAEATEVTVTAATDGDTFSDDRTVTVSVGKNTDSATSGTDYAAVADLDVTISAGETSGSGTFTLTPKQDTLVEGEEAVTVSGAATGLTVNGTSATITDDDTAPDVNLTTNPSSVSEGASGTTVTVTATFSNSSTYTADKTLAVSVGSTGTATSGTDYTAVTGFDLTISAGNSSGVATFTLTPKDDTLIEGNETIGVAGTPAGCVPGSPCPVKVNGATLTLVDDDDAPTINLSVNPSSVGEGDSATQVTVTANFSNTNTYTTNKTVTVTVGKNTDSATSGTDYAAVADIDVTINAGKTSGGGTFTLTPKDDTLVEGNETISVDGASTGMTVNGASVTLTDDDGAPVINLSVNPSSVAEDDSATEVTVTATFSNSSTYGAAKTVSVTVGDSADTATSGTDYAAVTAFDVTIAAGDSSGSAAFTLTPTDDSLVEGNETISLSGTSDLTVNGASVRLTDDDGAPAINLSVNPSSVAEDDSATEVTVTATFSNSSTYGAAKTVSVTVGDSADTATSGTDYAAVSAFDVTIAAGKSSGTATFTLTPTDDTVIEGNETISLSGTSDLTVNGASMTLTDDDSTEITLSTNPSSVAEEDSATAVTVTAETDGDTFTNDRTVRVKVGSASDSATSGKDYAAVTAFDITITAGETSATGTFTLTPTEDNIIEGEEAISVSGTSTGLTVNAASVTIDDNDEPKIILDIKPFLNTDPDKLPESAGATRVTVTAGTTGGVFELDRQIHVTVGKSGDTAVFGTDYDTPSKAFHVLITASKTKGEKTFTLTPTDDVIVEGDESLTLEGSAAGLEVTTATITIKDNDDANMTLAANPASVSEGAGATSVTVTASTGGVTFPADRTVTVTVGQSGDSATSGTDYAAVADFDVVISTGQNSGTGTFTLTPTNDTLVESDETITVSGTTADLTVTGTEVTLTDDEAKPYVVVDSPSVLEGDSGTTTSDLHGPDDR